MKRLRVFLDLELSEEDPEGVQATTTLMWAEYDSMYLAAGVAEFTVADLHVLGLVDETRP